MVFIMEALAIGVRDDPRSSLDTRQHVKLDTRRFEKTQVKGIVQ
jgi:hypothetical protein